MWDGDGLTVKPPGHRLSSLAVITGSVLGLAGCAGTAASASASTGTGGATGSSPCSSSACVPPVAVQLPDWFLEIDPAANSGFGLTELGGIDFAKEPVVLTADELQAVTTTFSAPAGAQVPASASVLLTLPSTIPGHAALTFQATAAMDNSSTISTITGTISIPASMSSRMGTLALTPLPPSDLQNPPYSFPVTVSPVTMADTLAETLPAGNVTVTGQIESAAEAPLTDSLVARVFQGGSQVSTASLTDTTGYFKILLGTFDPTAPFTVQLSPSQQGSADPWFTSSAMTLASSTASSLSLGTIKLPSYVAVPNLFNVSVLGADKMTAVSGALVQAQASLGAATSPQQQQIGSADFIRTGTTDVHGLVALSLLPGTVAQTLDYNIAVNPPSSSPYATTCLSPVVTVMGASSVSTPSAPTLATAMLPLRPVLTGTVTDSQGYAVANVTVTATAISGASNPCGNATEASASTSTSATGQFTLPLDPGTYQLDYDPPTGSSAPRLTEPSFAIAASTTHAVTLPRGGLISGTVADSNGIPLPTAVVRLFEQNCIASACAAPWLQGQAVTDMNGSFRVVVPLPADD